MIILASSSKYRKKLLKQITPDFKTYSPKINEELIKNKSGISNKKKCMQLAFEKANAVKEKFPEKLIIGSDQMLIFNKKIFDKPGTIQKAKKQLSLLQNKQHHLLTSLCILHKGNKFFHLDITKLKMKPLTKSQISEYIELDLPIDCCGSYKIENHGISLFSAIESQDFTAIQGLPLLSINNYLLKYT